MSNVTHSDLLMISVLPVHMLSTMLPCSFALDRLFILCHWDSNYGHMDRRAWCFENLVFFSARIEGVIPVYHSYRTLFSPISIYPRSPKLCSDTLVVLRLYLTNSVAVLFSQIATTSCLSKIWLNARNALIAVCGDLGSVVKGLYVDV